MTRVHVQVDGLTQLRRDLRAVKDPTQRKEVRLGFKKAADVVAQDARGRVVSRTGRAAKSIRAAAAWQGGSIQAFVVGGKAAVPYYGWLDFGSRSPVTGNPRSRGPWVRSGTGPDGGRFIYRSIEAREADVKRLIEDAVNHALNQLNL